MGVPSEMEVKSGEGRWCGGADKVVVVVGSCVHEMRGGEQVWVKNLKPSCMKQQQGTVCRSGVVVWCVQGSGGGGVMHLRNVRQGAGLGQKTPLWLSFGCAE